MNTPKPRTPYKALYLSAVASNVKLASDALYNFWFGFACGVALCVGVMVLTSFISL